MNYTQDIASLESAGLSDSQIAAVLSSVTVKPVPLWAFENFLDEQGLGYRDLGGKWRGTLPDAVSLPDPLGTGVTVLFSHVNKLRAEQIDTTQQPWCLMASELLAGLIQAEVITAEHREGFYALGGGLRHGAVTVGQIAELRTQYVFQSRVTNAVALFAERMTADDDPAAVMSAAWEDVACVSTQMLKITLIA